MRYRIIVRRTLFDFSFSGTDRLHLKSVAFLPDSVMEKKNDLLVLRGESEIQFFLNSATPVSRLTRQQYCFIAAVTRFLGYLPDQQRMPVWLWADSLEIGYSGSSLPEEIPYGCQPQATVCH